MPTEQGDAAYLRRTRGQEPNGEVTVEDFDRGVVETLGATIHPVPGARVQRAYYWVLPDVKPPPGMPGVPVIFAPAEDNNERFKIPYVKITPTGITPAMQRWHPGTLQYRAPAPNARELTINGRTGFDRMAQRQQAHPFDFEYSILLVAKRRSLPVAGGPNTRGLPSQPVVEGGSSNALLRAVLGPYSAYCGVNVQDSAGDWRTYTAFQSGLTPADEVNEVGDRVVGYSMTLRVEGELDVDPEEIHATATASPRPLTLRLVRR